MNLKESSVIYWGVFMLNNKYRGILDEYLQKGYYASAVLKIFGKMGTDVSIAAGDAAEDSVFDVASLTKLATSTQIMHLVKTGKLAIYDEILEYLPELCENPFLEKRLADVKLFQLLTHTSILPKWYPLYTLEGSFSERLEYALSHQEEARGVTYGDINFMLLGKIIENCYGIRLDESLQRNLVMPFKLGNMSYLPKDKSNIIPSSYNNEREQRICESMGAHFDNFRNNQIIQGDANDGNAYYYFGGVAGHAGIFADARSYQNLCQLYMQSDHCPFLLSAMQDKGMGRGFGFEHGERYPDGCGHSGFTGTALWISKSRNTGVVLFTNRLFSHQPISTSQIWDVRKHIFFEAYKDFEEVRI